MSQDRSPRGHEPPAERSYTRSRFLLAALLAACTRAGGPPQAPSSGVPTSTTAPAPAVDSLHQGLALLQTADDEYKRGNLEAAHASAARAADLLVPTGDVRAGAALQIVGHWRLSQKDCAGATAAYDQARAIRERAFGPDDALVGIAVRSLAEARRCAGDKDGAIADFERSYQIMAAIPSRLAERVDLASRLAPLLQTRGDILRAEALLRDVISAVESARGRSDPLYFQMLGPLDSVLRAQGQKDAAAELWVGLPTGEYCVPEPCPQTGPVQIPGPQVPVKPSPPTPGGQVTNAARVVAALRPAFKACYNEGLARDRRMVGRLEISMKVDASGAVPVVKAHRVGYLDDGVTRCVLDASRMAKFDSPAGGVAVIQVPVMFVPTQPGS